MNSSEPVGQVPDVADLPGNSACGAGQVGNLPHIDSGSPLTSGGQGLDAADAVT
jgi:hypothetical protein